MNFPPVDKKTSSSINQIIIENEKFFSSF